jgi:hypothetical protein
MSFAIAAKIDIDTADAGLIGSLPMSTKREQDPDFTPEAIAKQTAAFLRAGGKIKQVDNGAMATDPRMLGLQEVHAGTKRTKVNITLATTRQRAAKESKAKQQWKEHAAI